MDSLRPLQSGDHLVGYAAQLAHTLFEGITRDTGDSYTTAHLARVAEIVEQVTLPSSLRDAAVAAAWLHDAAEDIQKFDVVSSLRNGLRKEGVIYLNDLLQEAGEMGEAVCSMVDLLTHRPKELYQDYVHDLFAFPAEEGKVRDVHILAGIIKVADRRMNMDPDERRQVDDLVEEYYGLRSADESQLRKFYQKTKTIDAFKRKKIFDFDSGLFVETLLSAFRSKQQATALDNLTQYLPLAEERFLFEIKEQNGLFHWRKLRRVVKETYLDSLRALEGTGIDIYTVRRMGMNRAVSECEGYTWILKEIRNELASGKEE